MPATLNYGTRQGSSPMFHRSDSSNQSQPDPSGARKRAVRTASIAPPATKESILLVDDEEDLLELVAYNLAREGYCVQTALTGESALRAARSDRPDLIVLDLMLPGVDGLEVCRTLKSDSFTRDIPVLMLTAKAEEADVVTGLELGADDYVTKPFSPRVLMARIRAVLRRRARKPDEGTAPVSIRGLTVDPARHEVTINGRIIDLTLTEFRILHWLARNPGRVCTRRQIIDAIRGGDYPVTERSVDVQIVALRRKLGDIGASIRTVRGVGYRFEE